MDKAQTPGPPQQVNYWTEQYIWALPLHHPAAVGQRTTGFQLLGLSTQGLIIRGNGLIVQDPCPPWELPPGVRQGFGDGDGRVVGRLGWVHTHAHTHCVCILVH